MNIVCAGALHNPQVRDEISNIFVEGFYEWIKFFSKDKDVLKRAFAHMFQLESFFVSLSDGKIAGFASVCNDQINNIKLNPKELRKHLGFIMGTVAYTVLRKEFENKQYPFKFTDGMQAIEFVATHPQFRRMGVASQIIEHICRHSGSTSYVLEVADTNTKAVALYEKMGFREFTRVKMKDSKRSGINNLLYMKKEIENT